MAERLIYLPLGGAGEIGMNAYVYGYGLPGKERLILVDLGVTFGDMEGSLHCVDVATGGVIGSLRLAGGIEGVPWYGDLDGDGHAELVVTTTAGEVRAWRFAHGGVWLAPWYPGRGQFEGSVSL